MRGLALAAALAAIVVSTAVDAAPRRRAKPRPAQPPSAILHISSHLAEPAQVQIDGSLTLTAPGYGVVEASVAPGHHLLRVTTEHGVGYSAPIDLSPERQLHLDGRTYWCLNLLESAAQPYSPQECREEVADRG